MKRFKIKKFQRLLLLIAAVAGLQAFLPSFHVTTRGDEPDSVYLFSYATEKNGNHNGLHFAWSRDRESWYLIGEEYGYVKSDYGRWGSEKRMITPYLIQGQGGEWQCVWSLNDREPLFAHAASTDLINWGRQHYPLVTQSATVLRPVIRYDPAGSRYVITYTDKAGKYYRLSTKDFSAYSPAEPVGADQYTDSSISLELPTGQARGQLHRVPWSVAEKLIRWYDYALHKNEQDAEWTRQDPVRFAGLKPVEARISLQPDRAKAISNLLVGVFFEDLNYAADGGLYAELVQNRDFEYSLRDKEGHDKEWTSTHSWSLKGRQASFSIDSAAPLHPNNPHYAVLDVQTPGAALVNSGFDGIAVKKGAAYNLSFFARQPRSGGKLQVSLVDKEGHTLAQAVVAATAAGWKQFHAVMTATGNARDAHLELEPLSTGRWQLDMVSLFPQHTFKERPNGLRADLAQTIADIHPRFVRFPGGCVAHGDGLDNIYRWKNTIGPLESRVPQRNLWGYHQSVGLGFFEYFRFCEDIGAVPVPVVAAGVPCQNSGSSATGGGQQGGIPMRDMDAYVQDVLDLIEYANGDVHTKWGKKRAEAGHPAPFNLKYVGVGNEDLISDLFEERFTLIYNTLRSRHPEITVIGTVGPFFEGTDYEQGWQLANKLKVPEVDEHYYQPPGWFVNNQDFYDRYDRSRAKVYLGEYAAHLPGRPNNLETALAEALYLTALERNGDVVSMASYAPLLAKEGHTQWNPDLIYFNNSEVKPTVGYEVQKLYGINAGDEYLPVKTNLSNGEDAVRKRIAISVVRDSAGRDLILKMVNLLPVPVHSSIDLKGQLPANPQAVKTVLQGSPADLNARPVSTPLEVGPSFAVSLPPYSFTVIRIRPGK